MFGEKGAICGRDSGTHRHGALTMNASIAAQDLISHRAYMLRFAERRVRDRSLAEDAVHDVFEAVLSGRAVFAGRSALRSWLTAVLKNKLVDRVRDDAAYQSIDDEEDGAAATWACDAPRPDEVAEQRERLAHTLERIDALPEGLREAVTLRLVHDQPSEAVCGRLGITETNLFVRLHRARKLLAS
jgi:RNA polymerase sigma-70 factor (ECF subfamily)